MYMFLANKTCRIILFYIRYVKYNSLSYMRELVIYLVIYIIFQGLPLCVYE